MKAEKMKAKQWAMKSKIGRLYLVAPENGLQGVYWKKQACESVRSLKSPEPEAKLLAKAARQLKEYLEGKRRSFDLPLDPTGTAFQRKVWNELGKIPFGETRSYGQIAARIGSPGASRAVGSANGKNPLCLIVPCHRVIASNGTLGGFSGGAGIKARLLKLESKSAR